MWGMGNACIGDGTALPSLEGDQCDGAEGAVVSSKARVFPVEGRGISARSRERNGQTGGECLLFLECARNVPHRDLLRDLTCETMASTSVGHTFVHAWVEQDDGTPVGQRAQWPVKHCYQAPAWFSAQPLGFPIADVGKKVLRIDVHDQHAVIGSLALQLAHIRQHATVTHELVADPRVGGKLRRKGSVSFQILDSAKVRHRRTVYFIRHGESVWNEAQSKLRLHEMARTSDHPLSESGRRQAEELSRRIAEAGSRGDPAARQLLEADVVYASPLTRAIQTAVIALGPSIMKPHGPGEIVLMANAREKQNLGGFDTQSTKIGAEIVDHAQKALDALYVGCNSEATKQFKGLRFDAQEVQDRWWCEGASETAFELDERLDEFMHQLFYSPHRTIVVIGHSLFFRKVFGKFLSSDFPKKKLGLASKKLNNCGVIQITLDATRDLSSGPIVDARLLFDSELKADATLLNCCAHPEII